MKYISYIGDVLHVENMKARYDTVSKLFI